ncbi:MAG: hypothetical protein HYY18_21765 [Planctomycetes bacterium]|nr:hypothetical protein [Planctomycetota bacterium]
MTGILTLYVVSMLLVLSEAFVPGFVVGILGISGLTTSIIWAWQTQGPFTALAMTAVAVIVVPISIVYGLRRFSLQARVDGAPSLFPYEEFMGLEGTALTPLRPTGVALLKGRRTDVLTRGEPVEKGAAIRVLSVEGNRLIVGPAERRS